MTLLIRVIPTCDTERREICNETRRAREILRLATFDENCDLAAHFQEQRNGERSREQSASLCRHDSFDLAVNAFKASSDWLDLGDLFRSREKVTPNLARR